MEVNTVTLTKSNYDSLKGETIRCRMFLDALLNSCQVSEDYENLVFDNKAICEAMKVIYNDSYKKKLSTLRAKKTKEQANKIRG